MNENEFAIRKKKQITLFFSDTDQQSWMRISIRPLPCERCLQHHLYQMRPWPSQRRSLRRRIGLRREESQLRLARSTVALLQPGGNSRLQVSSQSAFAQRCRQVLALPKVNRFSDNGERRIIRELFVNSYSILMDTRGRCSANKNNGWIRLS